MISAAKFTELMKIGKFLPKNFSFKEIINTHNVDLKSEDNNSIFTLDFDNGNAICLNKLKIQKRYEYKVPLIRIEVDAPPHMNPDGVWLSRNHIHIYREGFGLRYAYELKEIIPSLTDSFTKEEVFFEFCKYCNISLLSCQGLQMSLS